MHRYFTKNAYSPVNRTQYIGAQRAEKSRETDQIPRRPNCRVREQEGRKCGECGTVLKGKQEYIIDWINQNLQALCIGCYRTTRRKTSRSRDCSDSL